MQLWNSWKGQLPMASFVLWSGLRMIHQDRPTLESNWPLHEQRFPVPSPLSPKGGGGVNSKEHNWVLKGGPRLEFEISKLESKNWSSKFDPLGWAWALVFVEFSENFEFQTGSIWTLHVAPSQGVLFWFFWENKMGKFVGETPQQNLKIFKIWGLLDFLCRRLPNCATSGGAFLEFEIQTWLFWSFSNGATSGG